jgi:long-chain acyl-CoA synthetase
MQEKRFRSIPGLFWELCNSADFPGWDCRRDGLWEHYSPERLKRTLFEAALAFSKMGVSEKRSLGIIAKTSPEWILADLAAQVSHAVTVPLFPNISEEHFEFQCDDSEVDFLAIDTVESLDPAIQKRLGRFRRVICFDSKAKLPANGIYWEKLLESGAILGKSEGTHDWLLYNIESIRPSDLFSVIYTSGSTGRPKGAEISQENMVSEVGMIAPLLTTNAAEDSAMSVLPVAHVFERMVICVYMAKHLRIYFADSPKNTGVIAHEVRPTIATFVPRILEKMALAASNREHRLRGLKRLLMHRALLFAKKTVPGRAPLRRKIYDRLVYRQIREAMGGRFRWIISGSSALNQTVSRFLLNMGFPVFEGYGLTECSPVVSVNLPGRFRLKSVGKPLPGLSVKIGEKNEILVKGRSVFQGYRNMPEVNRDAWTEDGYFRTGDQGIIDKDGFLFLIGRIKEIFKTSTGKYVSPVPVELELSRHPLIEAALVEANNRKFVSALLFLSGEVASQILGVERRKLDISKAAADERILSAVGEYVERVNRKLNHWEQIRKWTLVGEPVTVESGLMTPTFKLRRKAVEARYAEKIEAMYRD